ncbi:hypothetical protein J1614_004766 [Plenodomus biglobosus]|nr:hypothetical protein J1614_004766 [Plenodomus biglobosus]
MCDDGMSYEPLLFAFQPRKWQDCSGEHEQQSLPTSSPLPSMYSASQGTSELQQELQHPPQQSPQLPKQSLKQLPIAAKHFMIPSAQ